MRRARELFRRDDHKSEVYVYVNDKHHSNHFPSNHYKTTKYTPWTFLIQNMFEQFRKYTNIYFVVVTIVAFIPMLSTLDPYSILVPFVLIVLTNTVQNGFEDLKRYRNDYEINHRLFSVLRDGVFKDIENKKIQVGDIIAVQEDQEVPADCLIISTSDAEGIAYVETANLDGETTLKQFMAMKQTMSLTQDDMVEFKCLIKAEQPHEVLDSFKGNITLADPQTGKNRDLPPDNPDVIPLDQTNMMLRGVTLRNTKWALGIVVYAGVRTKLSLNQLKPSFQLSSTEQQLNKFALFVFAWISAIQIGFTLASHFVEQNNPGRWYVPFQNYADPAAVDSVIVFFSYFVILSYFIPISAFVNFEIAKATNAGFMITDDEMKNRDGKSMKVKSWNLLDELSRVEYIFTDKTGTLTENKMVFKGMTVDGVRLDDQELYNPSIAKSPNVIELLMNMACNHQLLPKESDGSGLPLFASPNPDEIALVTGAYYSGIQLLDRTKTTIIVRNKHTQLREGLDEDIRFNVLANFPFSSLRKRSSVVVSGPTGEVVLYTKGADAVMLERLEPGQNTQPIVESTHAYSVMGFRTLVFTKRVVPPEEWANFQPRWAAALSSIADREQQVAELMNEMEQNLRLQGCTSIEDKLQDGVPWAIDFLKRASIKIWMITGDKQETAENIGKSCKLLKEDTHIIRVVGSKTREACLTQLAECEEELKANPKCSLVIDGPSLIFALTLFRDELLEVGKQCETVIVCRADPIQKAGVVNIIKKGTHAVCLAIGDGANDVSMLQEATIGVGIYGEEGTQAARTADFAIHYFKHLTKLICVHGRYNMLRISLMFEYSFYKNIGLIGAQVWFAFFNYWSAFSFFDDWVMAWYNQLINGLPPIGMQMFEKDLSEAQIMKYPGAYLELRKGMYFTWYSFLRWIASAVWASAVIYFSTFLIPPMQQNGWNDGMQVNAQIAAYGGIWALLIRGMLATQYWVWLSVVYFVVAFGLTFVLYLPENAIVLFFPSFYFVANHALGDVVYWIIFLFIIVTVNAPDMLYIAIQREFFPWGWQIIQAHEMRMARGEPDIYPEPADVEVQASPRGRAGSVVDPGVVTSEINMITHERHGYDI